MSVTEETLRLQRQIRLAIDRITDQQTRDLVRAWAQAWDTIEPELNETLLELLTTPGHRIPRSLMYRSARLQQVLRQIADQLEELAAAANVRITADLHDVVDTAGAAQASVLDSQLPPSYADRVGLRQWSQVSPRAVNAIVRRSTQQITSRMLPLSRQTSAMVRRELVRGVAVGANPRVTASRVVRSAEARFNGDLGMTRALRIARTETLDAHRAGALLGRQQNADVMAGWTWMCELSNRSCPACIAQHGSLHPVDEIGPIDHVNGRCTALPRTKSWADLGFDVPEPPSLVPDARSWFEDLPAADQRSILGPGRYDAWAAGDYPYDAWSTVRSSDGWRDSIAVSRVPQRSVALAS